MLYGRYPLLVANSIITISYLVYFLLTFSVFRIYCYSYHLAIGFLYSSVVASAASCFSTEYRLCSGYFSCLLLC